MFSTAGLTSSGSAALIEETAIPNLGHSITVVLEGVVSGKSPDAQLAALSALEAVFKSIKETDNEVTLDRIEV